MKTIFLDMDGVVADFNAYANSILGWNLESGKRYAEDEWKLISSDPRFYSKIPLMPNAVELVDKVKKIADQHNYRLIFLTAVPRQNDVPYCFMDKIDWVRKHFGNIPVWFGPYSRDKHVHCSPGDVLVDDRKDNVEDWIDAGGTAILHDGTLDSIIELETII